MMNYIKSEWYRITHTKGMYGFTGIVAGLLLCMNVMLAISNRAIQEFPYRTVQFSLSALSSSMTVMMMAGSFVVSVLYSDEKKIGTIKNTIAFGISREKIFIGKCVVSVVAAFISMIAILAVYIGSAVLLLEGPAGFAVTETLKGVSATLLCAAAAVILGVALCQYFEKDVVAVIIWWIIMYICPLVCFFNGLKVELFNRVAEWLPWNFLKMETIVNMSGWQCVWDTPEGLSKCLIAGAFWIVVFLAAGLLMVRRREM